MFIFLVLGGFDILPQLVKKYPLLRQRILSPFVVGVSPNSVTVMSLFCGILSGYFFWVNSIYVAALFLGLCGFLDILDGEIARKRNRSSKKGDFLDHTVDRLADVFVFVGLAYNPFMPNDVVLLALVCMVLVSYLGTQAQAVAKERYYGGIVGRSDRYAILFAGVVMSYFFPGAVLFSVYLILVLSLVTFVQRFYSIYKKLD
ncbi:MAG: CDP-alcohol phosphatidyltransferase family protein [archaeon]